MLLDKIYEPHISLIQEKKWTCAPVFGDIDIMYAEWLSWAASSLYKSKELLISSKEYEREVLQTKINNSRDAIINFLVHNPSYVLITSTNNDFLFYRDQLSRFSLLCGTTEFIQKSYPCSQDTIKKVYFSYWEDDPIYTPAEKTDYKRFWEKYCNW